MSTVSRRKFLVRLASAAAFLAGSRPGFASGISDPFEFLVIGDSLVWGQGLEEDQKFYRLVKKWLRDEVFAGRRPVNLKVFAHSGSTIKLSPDEAAALASAEVDPAEGVHPEINVSFPSITEQLAAARRGYIDPSRVSLVLLSGSVPEVGIARILDPFRSIDKLRRDIALYSREHMTELLIDTAKAFPNALIAVVGYYPIITRHTPVKRIVNDVLELYNWPGWTKPVLNNPVNRILWRRYRRRMIKRSRIWHEDSTRHLTYAVNAVNSLDGRARAVFVPAPIAEHQAYGTKVSLLWKVAERGRAADPLRDERREECRPALDELREETKLKYRTRVCELASIGHPNAEGSAAIAESIRRTLEPLLAEKVSNL